jgi:hypothetical protein
VHVHVNPMADCTLLDRYNADEGTIVEIGRVLMISDVGGIAEPFAV